MSLLLSRRSVIAASVLAAAGALNRTAFAQNRRTLEIAEPAHLIGYVPLYVGINQGFYSKRGLEVHMITASGGAHVTALVSGDVWGNIGGPESDAMANIGKSDPLLSIVNLVNRANQYLVAKNGLTPKTRSSADIAAMLRGKRIAGNRYGGSSNILLRWYLARIGLDVAKDVTIVDNADAAAAPTLVKQGVVDACITQEPQIAFGIEQGLWGQPFFAFPSLGDFPWTVVSVRKSTIVNEPQVVQAFTDATLEALRLVYKSRPAVDATVEKEFPTLPSAGVKATLDRNYADGVFSRDGFISEKGLALDLDVVTNAGLLKVHTPYSEVVDMQFVRRATRR